MKINRSNYEIYFLDFIDGNLSVDLVDDFLDFLTANPDLSDELKSLSTLKLPEEKIIFEGKRTLLKNMTDHRPDFDYRSVAALEGDLSKEEQEQFVREMQSEPEKQTAFLRMKNMHLRSDTEPLFPDKERLLRNGQKRRLFIWLGSVAAIILLLLILRAVYPDRESTRQLVRSGQRSTSDREREQMKNPLAEKKYPSDAVDVKQAYQVPAKLIPLVVAQVQQTSPVHPRKEIIPAREEDVIGPIQLRYSPVELKSTGSQNPGSAGEKSGKISGIPNKQTSPEYSTANSSKSKRNPPPLATLAKACLLSAENISNNKLDVETNARGEVAEISFNTRLFGFSIPIKKNK